LGDAAPVVGLAHEYGHHLQSYLRLPYPRTARDSVRYENQADCIAGAWAKYASEKGWLEEADDLKDIEGLMRAIGSRESSYRDHGTTSERATAFNEGYKAGLKACTS
jgi:predicted metalloprotease